MSQYRRLREEIAKVIVGQDAVVESVLVAIFAGGHALLEGVPGLGKTLLVRTISQALNLHFNRIQFTPDLMPADITGTTIVMEDASGARVFKFQPGPIFANIVLADEINRATPKTQSALLEAMQEHKVTAGGHTYTLEEPFFVLATQNPIEQEGTYPLPEAQLDRFLFKVLVPAPNLADLSAIVERTTGTHTSQVEAVLDGQQVIAMQRLAREILVEGLVKEYALKVVLATQPDSEYAPDTVRRFVRFGSSPRGAQAVILAAKIHALLQGRYNVALDDVDVVAPSALRHRMILNFEGEAEGATTDALITDIKTRVREASRPRVAV
ncbi:MAG TPA: AAA family ATPase [Armatimonadota bacterium]|nr:AAA family ATPase [Armatimonadota bacterium]